jgi:tRNA (guanine26-N2/guanine27-N2)-dimethyltransferase
MWSQVANIAGRRVGVAIVAVPRHHNHRLVQHQGGCSTVTRFVHSFTASNLSKVKTDRCNSIGQQQRSVQIMATEGTKDAVDGGNGASAISGTMNDDTKNEAVTEAPPSSPKQPEIKPGEVPEGYQQIVEGQAKMIYRKTTRKKGGGPGQEVFYNPVQVQNRDLSILMISLFAERRAKRTLRKKMKKDKRRRMLQEGKSQKECQNIVLTDEEFEEGTKHITSWAGKVEETAEKNGLDILEALAASGLRSIRYAKEIPGVKHILVNDLDPAANEQCQQNVEFNQVSSKKVEPHLGDASQVIYNHRATQLFPPGISPLSSPKSQPFDVVDLDPYGSASPFLEAAVQGVHDGGLLCITCTDMKVLSGAHPDTCYGRYGSMPMPRGKYLQELALRIVLFATSTSAARYGRIIKPILSVGMAFYVRIFVEVYDDKAAVQKLSTQHGNLYQSTQCPTFYTVPHGQHNGKVFQPTRGPPVATCEETGAPFKVAGPLWIGPIHDFDVVDEAINRLEKKSTKFSFQSHKPLHGLLTSVSEELSDVPLYYHLPDLAHTLGCEAMPTLKWRAALHNAGYRSSAQHKEPLALKTDAPPHVVWDIMRTWVKHHCPLANNKQPNPTAAKILEKEIKTEIDFSIPTGSGFQRNRKKATRYPMNPEANWGPKPRATGKKRKNDEGEGEKASTSTTEDPSSKAKQAKVDDGGTETKDKSTIAKKDDTAEK